MLDSRFQKITKIVECSPSNSVRKTKKYDGPHFIAPNTKYLQMDKTQSKLQCTELYVPPLKRHFSFLIKKFYQQGDICGGYSLKFYFIDATR